MKRVLLISFLILHNFTVYSQDIVTDLNGFRLGQFREVPTNEFGEPFKKDKFVDDNFEYEAFLLNKETQTYMIFEYAAADTEIIWSIQITGDSYDKDIKFKNLKLGMNDVDVVKELGNPEKKINIDIYGERWEYEKTNYSVEISKQRKLSSIKIRNTFWTDVPKTEAIPSFKEVLKNLQASNNKEIADLLCPGIEIYYKDKTLFFSKSLENEIKTDSSYIFKTIKELSKNLDKIDLNDNKTYEENMRLSENRNPLHIIKIKKGHPIKEIVFDYYNGKYLIWEINAN